jgi:hypothetical protein
MRRMGIAVALTAGLLLIVGAAPAAAAAGGTDAVHPVLECVSANGDGSYTAVFGTFNPGTEPKTVPAGQDNFVSGPERDRGQPTTFAPGRTVASFSVPFTGAINWVLDGTSVTANRSSPPCNSAPNVSEAGMPVLLALVLVAMTGGWLRWQRHRIA